MLLSCLWNFMNTSDSIIVHNLQWQMVMAIKATHLLCFSISRENEKILRPQMHWHLKLISQNIVHFTCKLFLRKKPILSLSIDFAGNNDDPLVIVSDYSIYWKLISDSPKDYNTFASQCTGELFCTDVLGTFK